MVSALKEVKQDKGVGNDCVCDRKEKDGEGGEGQGDWGDK